MTTAYPVPGPLAAQYRLVTVAIIGLVTLIAFEALAVASAMPVVAADLDALRSYSLAFSLFFTSSLLGMVVAGAVSDVRGAALPLVFGLVLFAGGLVLCGTADTFALLLAGRIVSGAGGGALVVAAYVVIAAVYPDAMRPRVFGWISAAWVIPSVIGPPVAGWLAAEVSWRVVFLAVPPIAVLALALMVPQLRLLSVERERADGGGVRGGTAVWSPVRVSVRTRALAGLLLAAGAGLVQWVVQQVSDPTVAVVLAGLVGVALVAVSLPRLVPAGTLRLARGLPSVIVVRGLFTAAFFGAETYVPLALHAERGLPLAQAGLALTGGALGWAAGSYLQGRPGMALHRATLLSTGGLVVAGAVAALSVVMLPSVSPWVVVPLWAVAGLGMGLALSSTSVLVLGLSAPGQEGRNSASLQVSDALGSVFGVGAAGAVFAAAHTTAGQDSDVFAGIWLGLAVVGVLAAVVGRRVRQREPQPVQAAA